MATPRKRPEDKLKAGAPSLYRQEYNQKILEHMAKGKSMVMFCAEIDICRDTFAEWCKVHPEFSDSYKKAKEKCEGHWEDWLSKNLENKDVNSTLTKLYFANRFGWYDKSESKSESIVTIKHEEALKSLE